VEKIGDPFGRAKTAEASEHGEAMIIGDLETAGDDCFHEGQGLGTPVAFKMVSKPHTPNAIVDKRATRASRG
jgi:hypothetical protein